MSSSRRIALSALMFAIMMMAEFVVLFLTLKTIAMLVGVPGFTGEQISYICATVSIGAVFATIFSYLVHNILNN